MSEVKDNIRLGLGDSGGKVLEKRAVGGRRRKVSLECVAWLVE